ncbi:MAG: N-acetylmuramoyl-L-alanine amidase [Candidatus Kerfeldbacteria bacterium]|nr:N-acetylmuramoyl-L-alanine amidase [Candidatus Kerfeldbacteria bacterium]
MKQYKNQIQLILVFSLLFGVLSVIALSQTVTAEASGTVANAITHTPSDRSNTAIASADYISPVFTAGFRFNGLGLTWSGQATDQVEFAVQVDHSDWITLELVGDESKTATELFVTQPLFITGQQLQYKISGSNRAAVQAVRLIYFDSTIPPEISTIQAIRNQWHKTIAASNTVAVVSRAEWGADESYHTWSSEYVTPKKFLLHHTAGGLGGEDPTAVIRGIYYWHAVVLGWGDIGYNYIIDEHGTMYEGRAGGDGVVGAHAYNSATDVNYNQGSVGVALLGCYEATTGACAHPNTPTTASLTALTDLLASKAVTFSIAPKGKSSWFGTTSKNILGHRDVDATYCPGSSLFDQLKTIRQQTNNQYQARRGSQALAASFTSTTSLLDQYFAEDVIDFTATYTNTGRKTWSSSTVALQVSIAETDQHQRVALPQTVASNETVIFDISQLQLPSTPGIYTIVTKLYHHGQPVTGSKHPFSITVANPYHGKVISHTLPSAIQQSWAPLATITLTNNGQRAWDANDTVQLDGVVTTTLATAVKPGATITITLPLNSQRAWPIGTATHTIILWHQQQRIPGARLVHTMRVD